MIDISDAGDGVWVLCMRNGENRFNAESVAALDGALDELEGRGGGLVVTGDGKFFSNGLDLDWLGAVAPEEAGTMFADLHRFLGRLLRFGAVTVAAVNGHAFGAGAILTAAFDVRVMRAERGYLCFPEVDLGMAMTPEFDAVLRARWSPAVLTEALLSGTRYDGPAAQRQGLVDEAVPGEALLERAVQRARAFGTKDAAALAGLKAGLHRDALAKLPA